VPRSLGWPLAVVFAAVAVAFFVLADIPMGVMSALFALTWLFMPSVRPRVAAWQDARRSRAGDGGP